jgi:choline dehydrogenase-like flavoprotein
VSRSSGCSFASAAARSIGFATTIEGEDGPLWGSELVETLRAFRRWVGLLVMVNDDNNGSVQVDENGSESFDASFTPAERERVDGAFAFTRDVLTAAGASSVRWTGLLTTHVQGTCRMGSDPQRSVVDGDGQSWDVKRLYVGDGSLVPRTLSVNPSLTIMALADRLAEHLDTNPHRYL